MGGRDDYFETYHDAHIRYGKSVAHLEGDDAALLAQMAYDGLGSRARLTIWAAGVPVTTTYANRIAGQVQILRASSASNTTAYLYGLTARGVFDAMNRDGDPLQGAIFFLSLEAYQASGRTATEAVLTVKWTPLLYPTPGPGTPESPPEYGLVFFKK